jgi:glycine dehydrogenase subunit 1
LRDDRILAGLDLSSDYPELGNALLVCATETKDEIDLDRYAQKLRGALAPIERTAAA